LENVFVSEALPLLLGLDWVPIQSVGSTGRLDMEMA